MTKRTWIRSLAASAGLAAIVAAAAHSPARAADANGSFAIHGIGALTCSALTSGLLQGQTTLRETLGAWLTGYLSATNRLRAETYDATPIQQPGALTAMVVNLCVSNPEVLVGTAVNSLIDTLSVAAIASETPQQEVTVGERTARVRVETLAQMQSALIEKGLMSGPADGVFGEPTETALRDFQKDAGLAETGLPDPATIVRLLIGPSIQAGEQDAAPARN